MNKEMSPIFPIEEWDIHNKKLWLKSTIHFKIKTNKNLVTNWHKWYSKQNQINIILNDNKILVSIL